MILTYTLFVLIERSIPKTALSISGTLSISMISAGTKLKKNL
jgi:hypothetical protein